ncbi:hypothetical protein [Sphingomonas sp. Leaf242]|uniref:hypothetical protein n=1 Tax=Sphingomonas sp. Leaf242 TaxID=1736304 RepID=UPI0007125060|nr:hypothetical protein [Sphingomonas sp. Leaf242]KQO09422.1 hypothetical protein ASF09_07300 [Sphingomonas sp. Leaf242]
MNDPSRPRAYYSARKNGPQATKLSLDDLRIILYSAYAYYAGNGFFVEAFGYDCVDDGYIAGTVGGNIDVFVRMTLFKSELWPLDVRYMEYDEDDCFTMIEFLFDHVSKPNTKNYHDWNNCGYHYSDFDKQAGQEDFRSRFVVPLERYGDGWELTEAGEIMSLPPSGMTTLLAAKPPTDDKTVLSTVEDAKGRFRRHGSTIKEREVAVRDLADVLEWIKPHINTALMNKDSSDLYNIANQFGIRHMNQNQKLNYDKAVWLSWMFYHYLNTINAALHIIERQSLVHKAPVKT